jgi:hypothetical protein
MEINQQQDEIIGVVTTADVVEGKMGLLTSHIYSYDWGSQTDLPGFKVPATAEEANRANFVITWAVDNREFPLYQPVPSYTWALRQGFDKVQSIPFSASVYLTPPGNQESLTIPSGTPSLAFGEGIYTVPAVCYIYNAAFLTPGTLVQVANTAEDGADAGKVKTLAADSVRRIGRVIHFNATNSRLTFQIDK